MESCSLSGERGPEGRAAAPFQIMSNLGWMVFLLKVSESLALSAVAQLPSTLLCRSENDLKTHGVQKRVWCAGEGKNKNKRTPQQAIPLEKQVNHETVQFHEFIFWQEGDH